VHAAPFSSPLSARRQWAALAVLTLPVLLIAIDNTILGFAIPRLSESLEPTSSQLLWIIDVYSFVLAGLLVTMGTLGDRIGRRKLLLIGSTGFAVASVAAAFAPTAGALITARALIGLAGATLMPSTLSLIRNVFTDDRRRQIAIAVWAAAFGVGSAFGPLVGGLLLEHFWWGSVFLVAVPVIAALLVAAPFLVPESKDPNPGRFDVTSAALSMVAMFPIVYGMKVIAEHGLTAAAILSLLVGIGAGGLFVRRQRRLTDPMIDVTLFRIPRFRMAVSGNLISCFGFAGSMFFVTQYLQIVVGMSPTRAGLLILPAMLASAVCTMVAPLLARVIGAFAVVGIGLAVGAIGFACLSQVTVDGNVALTAVAIVLLNAGFGAAMAVAIDGILTAIPPERSGAGASVSETANELGIALGTAVLGSIMVSIYRRDLDAVDGVSDALMRAARETLGAADAVARDLGGALSDALRDAANAAFVHGVSVASLVGAALCALLAAWAFWTRFSDPDPSDDPLDAAVALAPDDPSLTSGRS